MLISRAMSELFSLRMHATRGGGHLSGAERLVTEADLEGVAGQMSRRALGHPRGRADNIRLSADALPAAAVRTGRLPDLATIRVRDFRQGRAVALELLQYAGISAPAARRAMEALAAGAAPDGRSMRGAMLVDADSGDRLEPDPARGLRAGRMDLSAAAAARLGRELGPLGLDNLHVREALVLAGKVLMMPGILAELCWSDDPEYTAGYVAAPAMGYRSLTALKPLGEERGGRAFFVRRAQLDLAQLQQDLQEMVVLFTELGHFSGETPWEDARENLAAGT